MTRSSSSRASSLSASAGRTSSSSCRAGSPLTGKPSATPCVNASPFSPSFDPMSGCCSTTRLRTVKLDSSADYGQTPEHAPQPYPDSGCTTDLPTVEEARRARFRLTTAGHVDSGRSGEQALGGLRKPDRRWSGNVRICHDLCHAGLVRDHKHITNRQRAAICSYFYAPEWTRTTTDQAVHKALNLVRPRHIRPPASRSSILCELLDTSDASDELTFVKDLSRAHLDVRASRC